MIMPCGKVANRGVN